ncbi:MAG: hypothetical protein GXP40_12110, partial [Chloroflexi bacterium]|nr:hypothetical protein [Chloroflexota bacterium]
SQLSNLPILKSASNSWAYLRVADGNLRLAHADQLHLDLWWRGENVALDPGTYLYNAAPPWDNPWPATQFHNTVTVNGLDQMTRAGRFMYLDWARGCVLEQSPQRIVAEHNGYRKLGVTHRRAVSFAQNTWRIEDDLIPDSLLPRTFRLHWLLPDWEWEIGDSHERVEISLKLPYGLVKVVIGGRWLAVSLARAGRLVYGAGDVLPTRGWVSPTYGVKKPALSFTMETISSDAVKFISEFIFPDL